MEHKVYVMLILFVLVCGICDFEFFVSKRRNCEMCDCV